MKPSAVFKLGAVLVLITMVATTTSASSRKFKNARVYVDDAAWYVGSWSGTNLAFEPPLDVEITILPSGDVYTFAHGGGKSYRVSTHGKVVKIRNLPDTPMRAKMQNASSMIIEDGGILEVDPVAEGLQTTAEKLGIVVLYRPVTDPQQLVEIQQRVIAQSSSEPHHKDNDFWHSPEFWGGVLAGAAAGASSHDDHITIENSGISKSDVEALQKYYK